MFELERERLIKNLIQEHYIKSDEVKKAFQKVPREKFLPDFLKSRAYCDRPQEIGHGQTISAPHMVAIMCEDLDLKEGQKILEIGSGSGYHAAIISKIVGEKGYVFSVERISSLAAFAKKNLVDTGIENVEIIEGDGSIGFKENFLIIILLKKM